MCPVKRNATLTPDQRRKLLTYTTSVNLLSLERARLRRRLDSVNAQLDALGSVDSKACELGLFPSYVRAAIRGEIA